MRIVLALIVGGAVLAFMGGRGIYEAAMAGSQKTVTYTQFTQKHPHLGWYKVTNASWDLEDCLYLQSSKTNKVDKVYIPVHATGEPAVGSDHKISLILETDREDLCNLIQNADSASSLEGKEALLHSDGPLNGTVVFGGDIDNDDRDKMAAKFGSQLDPQYAVLKDGDKPNIWKSIGCLIGGIVLGLMGLAMVIGRRR